MNSPAATPPRTADQYFLRHVLELCEKRKVIAADDVYATTGVKLVAKNTRIDMNLHERLDKHRLVRPLDQCILIEESVNAISLLRLARELMDTDPLLITLRKGLTNQRLPQEALAKVPLANIATKVTVMREQMPKHYRHSVKAALVAATLGFICLRKAADVDIMAAVGLFHDLGDLHVDPAVFITDQPLTPEQHQQIRMHPVTAAQALEQFSEYRPYISRAVLEHHERMDGCGYPMGLTAADLSIHGRIMAVAELAVGISERPGGLSRLAPILKAQFDRLDPAVTGTLLAALKDTPTARTAFPRNIAELADQVEMVQRCLQAAPALEEGVKYDAATSLLLTYLEPLRTTLRQAGLTGLPRDALVEMLDEPGESFVETGALTAEAFYQVQGVLRELNRLESQADAGAPVIAEPLRRWMKAASAMKAFRIAS